MRVLLPVLAMALWCAGSFAATKNYVSRFPPPSGIHVPVNGAAGDMFALALGMRRLFADVWFIRLMQYYASLEINTSVEHEEPVYAHGHHQHHHLEGGVYPEFLKRSLHVLEIDPGFTLAALYGAGSLAFNLNRGEEAQAVLNYALEYSPKEWKYLNMLAAIGYSKAKDPAAVAGAIAPILAEKDCPVMLKQQAAFLNKKIGNYAAAAVIYADIAATSRDMAYVRNAQRELAKLSLILGRRELLPPGKFKKI